MTCALVASLIAAATAAPAQAQLGARVCGSAGTQRCGTVPVPIDRSNGALGQVGLAEAVRPAGAVPTQVAVVPLAGGPGQAALPFVDDFAQSLKPLLGSRDLLVFDQRGTGSSGAIGCFGDAGPSSAAQVSACASGLGGARAFYRSIDSAQDIEALRVAGGYDKLVLYAVSYGTRVALTYAALHPDRVAGLVLDSVVPLDGPDVWSRQSFGALARVLRNLCSGDACRLATPSPNADLKALSRHLARTPLSGSITGPDGSRITVRLTEGGLWQILLAGDLNPTLRAELPGAMRAALRGDRTPVLRLRARAAGLSGTVPTADTTPPGLQTAADDVNTGLFTATRCSETNFPWTASASAGQRLQQATTALRGVGTSRFAPFDLSVPLTQSVVQLCASWPDAPLPAAPLGPLPAVPTLVLEGMADLRTPVEQARTVVSAIAGARLYAASGTGHSVLGSDLSGCADAELAAFAANTTSTCNPTASPIRPTPRPPLRLSALPGGTKALRTVTAVHATVDDARRQLIGDAIASGRSIGTGSRTGGLRSGVAIVRGDTIDLRRVSYVPGVRVSGTYALKRGQSSQLLVTGPAAARGRLTIDGTGTARGVLGGSRVQATFAAAASAAGPSGWPRSLALPAFAHPALRPAG
jgi:pimeloyl-ACP methyl ester carboxylesterase